MSEKSKYHVTIECDFLLPPTDPERGVFDQDQTEKVLAAQLKRLIGSAYPFQAQADTLRLNIEPSPSPAERCPRCGGKGTEMSADSFDQDSYLCWDCRGTGCKPQPVAPAAEESTQ